jgi:hypothetical protein
LASYREEELAKMRVNYFGADRAYHQARQAFVFKGKVPAKEKLRPIPVAGEGTAIAKFERRPAPMTETSGLEIADATVPAIPLTPAFLANLSLMRFF